MTDIIDNANEFYESQFKCLDDLNLELDPIVTDALHENIFLNDLFYDAVAEGNMEDAKLYADMACENAGLEVDFSANGTYMGELENFIPTETNDAYNCDEAMVHWEYQGDTNRCAQMAQLSVIEEFTGQELDPNEFCQFSYDNGWYLGDYGEDSGTTEENLNKMLDYFGIDNEMSKGNSIDDLLNCIENGGRAIVTVDAGEYWYNEGYWDDLFDPNHPDHAIEVIGYDPETNSVIVNDSALENGSGLEIPLETFQDAWADGNNTMIECYR